MPPDTYKLGFVGMFAQTKAIVSSTFSKAGAQRLERQNGIFFLQSFFFWAFFLKRKSVYQILIPKGVSRFSLAKGAAKKS